MKQDKRSLAILKRSYELWAAAGYPDTGALVFAERAEQDYLRSTGSGLKRKQEKRPSGA